MNRPRRRQGWSQQLPQDRIAVPAGWQRAGRLSGLCRVTTGVRTQRGLAWSGRYVDGRVEELEGTAGQGT